MEVRKDTNYNYPGRNEAIHHTNITAQDLDLRLASLEP